MGPKVVDTESDEDGEQPVPRPSLSLSLSPARELTSLVRHPPSQAGRPPGGSQGAQGGRVRLGRVLGISLGF